MRTRYTHMGESVIEVVIDNDEVSVNILAATQPSAPLPAEAGPPAPEPEVVTPPLPPDATSGSPASPQPALNAPLPLSYTEVGSVCPEEELTPRKRTLMGTIRAGWFIGFTVAGEALTYALNNLANFNLPPGTATAVGAIGYGLKKAVWPETLL